MGKVVSAQRIALDRCHFSYVYAKEKAWVRMVRNTRVTVRKAYNEATETNMAFMDNSKQRM